jgi:ribosome-associated toxin RatA of RatAB toxin-antitoxin module
VLADVAAYPSWWPRHLGLRVLHREAGLVGSEVEQRPFGGRPFRCRVEAVEEPSRIRTQYHGGFIEGRGEWRLEPVGAGTRVRYELDVHAEGRVVAWLGRILPLGRLHSRQMQKVFRQLQRVLMQGKVPSPPGKEEEKALG